MMAKINLLVAFVCFVWAGHFAVNGNTAGVIYLLILGFVNIAASVISDKRRNRK